ncbi:MAG: hypothetical protein V9G04_05675 [Nocardioides sp.]|jgi:cell division protein FtsB
MSMSQAFAPLRDRLPREGKGSAPRLRAVTTRRPRAPKVPFVVALTAILVGGVVGLLLFNTSLQQASFAAAQLEDQAQTLTAREQSLRMELDALREPQRVAEAAQKMGMVPAGTPAFLDLSTGRILGEPTPATAENGVRLQPLPPVKPAILAPKPKVRQVMADTARSTSKTRDRRGNDGASAQNRQRR